NDERHPRRSNGDGRAALHLSPSPQGVSMQRFLDRLTRLLAARPRPSRPSRRLTLEALEGRTLLDAGAFGQVKLFAPVPAAPGFPEGIAVFGDRVYVAGPARFGTAGTGPSALEEYKRSTGELVRTIAVAGEDLAAEHALSNIAIDGDGRVYGLSTQLGLL